MFPPQTPTLTLLFDDHESAVDFVLHCVAVRVVESMVAEEVDGDLLS